MSPVEALKAAHAAGVRLTLDGSDLALEAASAPPAGLLDALAQHKAGIVALLQPGRDARAALARLSPADPPGDIPRHRWAQFIDDCDQFLVADWPHRAAALGWTPLDLFGCDRERPWARIDRLGLLWLLNGGKIVALTAETAVIETPAGTKQTCRRSAAEPSSMVLAWEPGGGNV